jgi:hypothetical protein
VEPGYLYYATAANSALADFQQLAVRFALESHTANLVVPSCLLL